MQIVPDLKKYTGFREKKRSFEPCVKAPVSSFTANDMHETYGGLSHPTPAGVLGCKLKQMSIYRKYSSDKNGLFKYIFKESWKK